MSKLNAVKILSGNRFEQIQVRKYSVTFLEIITGFPESRIVYLTIKYVKIPTAKMSNYNFEA